MIVCMNKKGGIMRYYVSLIFCGLILTASNSYAENFSNMYRYNPEKYEKGTYNSVATIKNDGNGNHWYVVAGSISESGGGIEIPIISIIDSVGYPSYSINFSSFVDEIVSVDTYREYILVAGNKGDDVVLIHFPVTLETKASVKTISRESTKMTVREAKITPFTGGFDQSTIAVVGSSKLSDKSSDYWVMLLDSQNNIIWEKDLEVVMCMDTSIKYNEEAIGLDFALNNLVVVGNYKRYHHIPSFYSINIIEFTPTGTYRYWCCSQGGNKFVSDVSYHLNTTGYPVNIYITGWTDYSNPSWPAIPGSGRSIFLGCPDYNTVISWKFAKHTTTYWNNFLDIGPSEGVGIKVNSSNELVISSTAYSIEPNFPPDGYLAKFDTANGDFIVGRLHGEYLRHRNNQPDEFKAMTLDDDNIISVGFNSSVAEVRGFDYKLPWFNKVKSNLRGGYTRPMSWYRFRSWTDNAFCDPGASSNIEFHDRISNIVIEEVELTEKLSFVRVPMPSGRTSGWLQDCEESIDYGLIFGNYTAMTSSVKWWDMDSTFKISEHSMIIIPCPNFKLVAMDDIMGNEVTDLLFRHPTSQVRVYAGRYNASHIWQLQDVISLENRPDPWQITGTGDFNKDGVADIVWRNLSSGKNEVWIMDYPQPSPSSVISLPSVRTTLTMAGVADLDNDNNIDLIFENSKEIVVFFLYEFTIKCSKVLVKPLYNCTIGSLTDLNVDGYSDFVLRDQTTGINCVSFLNGGSCDTLSSIGFLPVTWETDVNQYMEGQ